MSHLHDENAPIKPDKGLKGGSCNRRACQRPGATWFNRGSRMYYCPDCGRLINRENPDMFGGRMCVPPDHTETEALMETEALADGTAEGGSTG